MRSRGSFLIWVLLSTLVTGFAAAQTANSTDISYKKYKSLSGDDKSFAELYLHGMFEGLGWANAVMIKLHHEQPLFCQPITLALTSSQELSMLDQYISVHPEYEDLPMGLVAEQVAEYTFPCPKTSK